VIVVALPLSRRATAKTWISKEVLEMQRISSIYPRGSQPQSSPLTANDCVFHGAQAESMQRH
jgi:hypothetical protein